MDKSEHSHDTVAAQGGTIEKALDVLFHLHEVGRPMGVTAIARALNMSKSSVHRLLTTLTRRGLVEQDERGQYEIGVALIALGLGALAREPVAVAAHPVLEQAAAEVGETFFLVVARAGQLIVLDKAEGNGFMRAAPQIGASVPVHATAVGKLYLLYAPQLVQLSDNCSGERAVASLWGLSEADIIKGKKGLPDTLNLPRYTEHTRVEMSALRAELEQVRQQGWASNLDEWQPGLSVLAAPILVGQQLLGTIALALIGPRLQELGIEKMARRVVHAAESIALRLEGKRQ